MLDTKEIKKVLKVLLRKSKGLSRLKRIDEMNYGLRILNMHVVRQRLHSGLSVVSNETMRGSSVHSQQNTLCYPLLLLRVRMLGEVKKLKVQRQMESD